MPKPKEKNTKKRAETRASLLATAKLLFEKLGYSSITATRRGFMAIDHFLKINDDFLTNSNTKPYSRFNNT